MHTHKHIDRWQTADSHPDDEQDEEGHWECHFVAKGVVIVSGQDFEPKNEHENSICPDAVDKKVL